MHKVKIIANWGFKLDCTVDVPTELYVDCIRGCQNKNDSKKILLLFEPEEFSKSEQSVINNHKHFDYILTHNEKILNSCPNAILFEFGSTWIGDDYAYPEKRFEVSTLVGFKNFTHGHKMRHELWKNKDRITVPNRFFLSKDSRGLLGTGGYPVLGEKKDALFESQFHIVIENARRKYWFTEKLIDCFKTKTIPIYWGCTNIGDYFNTDGMIIVDNINDIYYACNNLTEEDYKKMLPAVEENYEKGKEFEDLYQRINDKIKELTT